MKIYIIVISFCLIFTLRAMEQQGEIFIGRAQEKHIPAVIALSKEVVEEFFKPSMIAGYPDNPSVQDPDVLHEFFGAIDLFLESFSKKATSDVDNNLAHLLIASETNQPDKLLGLCAFTKEEASIFIQYLIVSRQSRGRGVGKALLNKALSMYADVSMCRLVTLAYGNEPTQAFYERLGFTTTKDLCTVSECIPNTHFLYQLDIKK